MFFLFRTIAIHSQRKANVTPVVHVHDASSFGQIPQLVEGLVDKDIVKVASHPEARHFLALTTEGELFSWGSGDKGKLGHGDTR